MATILTGLIGGLIATILMTIVMRGMGGGPPPTAALLAKFRGGSPDDYMMPGMLLHLLYGTIAGGVLVAVVTGTTLGIEGTVSWTITGIVYAIVLMVLGAIVWIRMVIGMEPDRGMMLQFGIVHLVYGVVLGVWIGAGVLG